MENLVWVIYLIDVFCDGLGGWEIILLLLSIGSAVGVTFEKLSEGSSDEETIFVNTFAKSLPLRKTLFISVAILVLSGFIPSKDTAYKMLAAYGAIEVIQNEDVQEVFGEGMDVLKLALKDYKEELENKSN